MLSPLEIFDHFRVLFFHICPPRAFGSSFYPGLPLGYSRPHPQWIYLCGSFLYKLGAKAWFPFVQDKGGTGSIREEFHYNLFLIKVTISFKVYTHLTLNVSHQMLEICLFFYSFFCIPNTWFSAWNTINMY